MCGNSYIYLDNRRRHFDSFDLPNLARAMSDPRIGIGSDGLILLEFPKYSPWALRMRMFNRDGSKGDMCGNGLLGLGRYIAELEESKQNGWNRITIETDSGLRSIESIVQNGVWKESAAILGMPRFHILSKIRENILPFPKSRRFDIGTPFGIMDASCVSMGNLHCTLYVDRVWSREDVEVVGSHIEAHYLFPDGVNVQFVHVRGAREVDAQVWERGSGYTPSSGTSSGAILATGIKRKVLESPLTIHWPGGDMTIRIGKNWSYQLEGPVVKICEGVFHYD